MTEEIANEQPSKRDSLRTKTGWLTLTALLKGMAETQAWKIGRDKHVLKLWVVRTEPEPPLIRVEHTITHGTIGESMHATLFDDVRKARSFMRKTRSFPPAAYVAQFPEVD